MPAISRGEEKVNPYRSPTESLDDAEPPVRSPLGDWLPAWLWDTALLFGTGLAIVAGAIVLFSFLYRLAYLGGALNG
jgi:hypothetical protein